jgi:hypothetical protein
MKMTFDIGGNNDNTLAILEFEGSSPALIEALKTNIGETSTFDKTTEFYVERLPIGITQATIEAAIPFEMVLAGIQHAKENLLEGFQLCIDVQTHNHLVGYVIFPMTTADEMADQILGKEMLPTAA